MLVNLEQAGGVVTIQLADGTTRQVQAAAAELGAALLAELARPQPEQETAPAGEPPAEVWIPKGQTLEEVSAELETMARANAGRALRGGLGWLRSISTHGRKGA